MKEHVFWVFLALLGLAVLLTASCDENKQFSSEDNAPPPDDDSHSPDDDNNASDDDLILFGDLHSHGNNSLDALALDIPLVGGMASHPPEVSCEFARYCAGLDFWALTDHAEEQSPLQWKENVAAVRQCDESYGEVAEHSLISFLGWEWSFNGDTPDGNYGHHNVVLKGLGENDVPPRPFAAPGGFAGFNPLLIRLFYLLAVILDGDNEDIYAMVRDRVLAFLKTEQCDPKVDTLNLPPDCHEIALDLASLYSKFDRWGIDALVIPHGMTWGPYHPLNSSWDHLTNQHYDPHYSPVIETDSGHGNAEQYRTWQHAIDDGTGHLTCPEPQTDFEPCCWRAGEITRSRSAACAEDPHGEACEAEVAAARQAFLDAGNEGIKTIRHTDPEDWLDCGQCRDCIQPPLDHRPAMSIQAAMTISNTDSPDEPWRYKFGFIGSTDSHRAGPGAGYKEFKRLSDGYGPVKAGWEWIVELVGSMVTPDYGRQNSFFYTGSLIGVHVQERSREAIWDAVHQRNVYATSGARISLWFDLVNGPDGESLPMGSEAPLAEFPNFLVKVIGAFKEADGCPGWVQSEKTQDFIDSVCFGECYNPTTERYTITYVDVIKVRPRTSSEEPTASLIDDPFVTLSCPSDPEGCTVTFSDSDFIVDGRPAAYYVRAYQEPTEQFNVGNLRCVTDEEGNCIESVPCDNGVTGVGDDCRFLAPEIAWSSPIFLTVN